ncbi:glutamine synthetase [Aspergillus bombycis]|uniref:Glutamine synthetase n=1 Tax=Aspergillus bombycis TaxID=109264 RepID=A0A1F7ZR06_9EURO|nr:glutamine synthetase [Aspergillus bombycis]OGM41538.1 glutamine synthetase [Aspergillus bombycis]
MATEIPTDANEALDDFYEDYPHIIFIRLQWQDYSGVMRALVLPIEEALIILATEKQPFHVPPLLSNCSMTNQYLPDASARHVQWLVPDWSSIRLTADPRSAVVMCGVVGTTISKPVPSGDLCPRRALVDVVRQAQDAWNLEFLIGFEVEFQVMKVSSTTGEYVKHSQGPGNFSLSGLRDPCYQYVQQCVQELSALGVHIHGLHSEGKRGQYEIALKPLPPMQAVDQLHFVHDYLKDTFAKHGYMATMAPKPLISDPHTIGQHMHLSLESVDGDYETSFLAGILKRLPMICAFCLPHTLSYERRLPFLAGETVCWGTEARIAPIRKIEASHWEIRCIDATANMYLTLAAVLGAGILGLAGQEPLLWPDLGDLTIEPKTWEEPLPRTLQESLACLATKTDDFATIFGLPLIQRYIELKQYEISQVGGMDPVKLRELFIELF